MAFIYASACQYKKAKKHMRRCNDRNNMTYALTEVKLKYMYNKPFTRKKKLELHPLLILYLIC